MSRVYLKVLASGSTADKWTRCLHEVLLRSGWEAYVKAEIMPQIEIAIDAGRAYDGVILMWPFGHSQGQPWMQVNPEWDSWLRCANQQHLRRVANMNEFGRAMALLRQRGPVYVYVPPVEDDGGLYQLHPGLSEDERNDQRLKAIQQDWMNWLDAVDGVIMDVAGRATERREKGPEWSGPEMPTMSAMVADWLAVEKMLRVGVEPECRRWWLDRPWAGSVPGAACGNGNGPSGIINYRLQTNFRSGGFSPAPPGYEDAASVFEVNAAGGEVIIGEQEGGEELARWFAQGRASGTPVSVALGVGSGTPAEFLRRVGEVV